MSEETCWRRDCDDAVAKDYVDRHGNAVPLCRACYAAVVTNDTVRRSVVRSEPEDDSTPLQRLLGVRDV